ncbi:MAG: hypothetical protein OWT27_07995 [Firmicutes bacterium]|nr:hypothetical protein [Bacillota bacterium]
MTIRPVLRRIIELDAAPLDDEAKRDALVASLSEQELCDPTARWLQVYAHNLSWLDNILDLATRYFGLPPKPVDPVELASYQAIIEEFRASHAAPSQGAGPPNT